MRSNLFPVLRMFGVWTSMVLGNELFVFHEPLPPGRKPRSWSGWIQERIHYQLFHNSKVYIINVIVFEITSKYNVIHPIQCFHLRIVTCLSRVYRDRWIPVSRDIRKYGKTLVSILSNISRQFVAKKACRPIKKTIIFLFSQFFGVLMIGAK